jgi:hypothetical protein
MTTGGGEWGGREMVSVCYLLIESDNGMERREERR